MSRLRAPLHRAGCILLALTPLAACGVDGVPLHPNGRPATEIEEERNVTISGSAGFGVSSGARPPSSQGW